MHDPVFIVVVVVVVVVIFSNAVRARLLFSLVQVKGKSNDISIYRPIAKKSCEFTASQKMSKLVAEVKQNGGDSDIEQDGELERGVEKLDEVFTAASLDGIGGQAVIISVDKPPITPHTPTHPHPDSHGRIHTRALTLTLTHPHSLSRARALLPVWLCLLAGTLTSVAAHTLTRRPSRGLARPSC